MISYGMGKGESLFTLCRHEMNTTSKVTVLCLKSIVSCQKEQRVIVFLSLIQQSGIQLYSIKPFKMKPVSVHIHFVPHSYQNCADIA